MWTDHFLIGCSSSTGVDLDTQMTFNLKTLENTTGSDQMYLREEKRHNKNFSNLVKPSVSDYQRNGLVQFNPC